MRAKSPGTAGPCRADAGRRNEGGWYTKAPKRSGAEAGMGVLRSEAPGWSAPGWAVQKREGQCREWLGGDRLLTARDDEEKRSTRSHIKSSGPEGAAEQMARCRNCGTGRFGERVQERAAQRGTGGGGS